jgi:hypothetical protein
MQLTTAQFQTIKADILANPDLAAFPNSADGNFARRRLQPDGVTGLLGVARLGQQE